LYAIVGNPLEIAISIKIYYYRYIVYYLCIIMDKRINHNQEGNIIVPGKYLILSDQLLGDVDFQDVFLRE